MSTEIYGFADEKTGTFLQKGLVLPCWGMWEEGRQFHAVVGRDEILVAGFGTVYMYSSLEELHTWHGVGDDPWKAWCFRTKHGYTNLESAHGQRVLVKQGCEGRSLTEQLAFIERDNGGAAVGGIEEPDRDGTVEDGVRGFMDADSGTFFQYGASLAMFDYWEELGDPPIIKFTVSCLQLRIRGELKFCSSIEELQARLRRDPECFWTDWCFRSKSGYPAASVARGKSLMVQEGTEDRPIFRQMAFVGPRRKPAKRGAAERSAKTGRQQPSQRPKGTRCYRHPEQPELTWSGRGRRPKWLNELLDAGVELDRLRGTKPVLE